MNEANKSNRKTTVYLVRHGVTDWNLEQRIQGHLDISLNQEGLAQAASVAQWLARQLVTFRAIYTSDLQRAAQTAQAIGAQIGLTPIPAEVLRERHCGVWAGMTSADLNAQYPDQVREWRADRGSYVLPGGESLVDVQQRVMAFYYDALSRHEGETIMIVSHGGSLLTLVAAVQDWSLNELWRDETRRLGNTAVTIITHCNGTPQVDVFNSLAHLSE